MRRLADDLRYAAKQLRRTPGFAAIAVLTLSLGIGVNTAVFAIINALDFRPMGIASTEGVFALSVGTRMVARPGPPPLGPIQVFPTASDVRAFATRPPDPISAAVVIGHATARIRVPGRAERGTAETSSGDAVGVFRLSPQVGRWIEPNDDAAGARVVVVSDRLWRDWFGGDRDAIGRTTITVNEAALTVVGVAPRGFRGLTAGSSADVWLPAKTARELVDTIRRSDGRDLTPEQAARVAEAAKRDVWSGTIFVRSRPGAAVPAVEAAAKTLFAGTLASKDASRLFLAIRPAADELLVNAFRPAELAILALSSLVLLAACANLANLLYARGTKRAGEIAVRLALGGSRRDIFRLFLAETAILATLAMGGGLAIAAGALRWTGLVSSDGSSSQTVFQVSRFVRFTADMSWDLPVIFFACGAGALSAILVGLATAWRASRVPPFRTLATSGLAGGSTVRGKWRRLALVAVQVTAAVLLLMGTGLYVQRASESLTTNVLFDTSHVTAARIDLTLQNYNETRGRAFYERVLERVRAIPNIDAAALTDGLPGFAYVSSGLFLLVPERGNTATGNPSRRVTGAYAGVSPGFLDVLGLRLLRGRPFTNADADGAPLVTIVCESAAARLWPSEDAIGKRLMFGSEGKWLTVIGISSDPIRSTTDTPGQCQSCVALVPWAQRYRAQMLVMVRSATPTAIADPLRAAIGEVDPDVVVQEAAPIDESLLAWVRPMRAAAILMASLGLVALAIAAIGVYGVVSFLVGMRTREFGIRLALGATPRRIVVMVLDQAVHLILVGLLPGVFIAAVLSRILESSIARLMPNDITTWVVVPLLVMAVGVMAGYVPARRASRVDPNVALRDL